MKQQLNKIKNSLKALYMKLLKLTPIQTEEDLTLHFSKEELFDQHVILPHSEVNPIVYETVDRFIDRYGGDHLNLTIYTGDISESAMQFFREAFVSHYEDEYRQRSVNLYRWYWRVLTLILIGVATYYIGVHLETQMGSLPFLITAIANVSLFCIWEVCNTDVRRRETIQERKKIARARDADIRFHYYTGPRRSSKKASDGEQKQDRS